MITYLIIIYILILWSELPELWRLRWYKELAVFSVIFLLGFYMGMVQFYHWPFYDPFAAILPMWGNSNP
jgi:hypothetical protein